MNQLHLWFLWFSFVLAVHSVQSLETLKYQELGWKAAPPREVEIPKYQGGWKAAPLREVELLDDQICNIDRISIKNLTKELFEKEYRLKKPVIITFPNGIKDWSDEDYWGILKFVTLGEVGLKTTVHEALVRNDRNRTMVKSYWNYVNEFMKIPRKEPSTCALQELGIDVEPRHFKFARFRSINHQLTYLKPPSFLTADISTDRVRLCIGGSRYGSMFHQQAESWRAVPYGRKRWFLYPGHRAPPGGASPGYSPFDWYSRVYPHLDPEDKPLECVQEDGEILYLADSFYHSDMNIGETVSLESCKLSPLKDVQRLVYEAPVIDGDMDGEPLSRDVANHEDVITAAGNILDQWPEQYDVLLRLGQEYRETGNLAKSIEILKRILTNDPWAVMANLELALDFKQLQEVNTAEALVCEALMLNPAQYWTYSIYFDLLSKQNRHMDALLLMLQAEKHLWMHQKLWKLWADTLLKLNNIAAASMVYQTIYYVEEDLFLNSNPFKDIQL